MSQPEGQTNPGHDGGTLSDHEVEMLSAAVAQQAAHGCPKPPPDKADEFLRRRRGQRLFIVLLLMVVLLLGVWGASLLVFGTLYSPKGAVREYQTLLAEYDSLAGEPADSKRWTEFQTRSRRVANRYTERFRRSAQGDRPSHVKLLEVSETLWPSLIQSPPAAGSDKAPAAARDQISALLDDVEKAEASPIAK